MNKQCVNCPGAEDHSTAECPISTERTTVNTDMPLPCEIKLPGGMKIGKGCKLGTLLTALQNRGDDMPWRQRFGAPMPFDPALSNLAKQLHAAPTVKAEQVPIYSDLRAKLIEGLDEIGALSRNLRQGGCDSSDLPGLEEGLTHAIDMAHELIALLESPLPAACWRGRGGGGGVDVARHKRRCPVQLHAP